MAAAVVTRDALRRDEAALAQSPVAYARLTASATVILDQASPLAIHSAESTRINATWQDALKSITDQNWLGFVDQASATVSTGDGALTFFEGIGAGAVAYVESELDGYIEMGSSVGAWIADGSTCALSGIKSLLWRDEIVDAQACKSLKAVGNSLEEAYFAAKRFFALTNAEKLELLEGLCKVVMDVFNDTLTAILNWASEQRDRIRTWLEETARNAKRLGELAGKLLTALILEYVTAGAARALKSAKVVSKLPDPPSPTGVSAVERAALSTPDLDLLDDLFKVFQGVLRQNRAKFSRNMTLRKLGLIRESLSADALEAFAARRRQLEALLGDKFSVLRNRIDTHAGNVAAAREFNRRWLTFIYADTLVDDVGADPLDLLSRKDSIVAQLFESNHIVEQRVFKAATGKLKDDFATLGWTGPDDMPAILLPSSQHTASVKRMLDRYAEAGMVLDPEDLKALTVRTDNLTEMLKAAVKVEPGTRLLDVLATYRNVYRTFDGGVLWTPAMEQSFAGWIVKLGGTP